MDYREKPHKSRKNGKNEINSELLQVTRKCCGKKMLLTGTVPDEKKAQVLLINSELNMK